jgi:hypothetical protein
MASLIASRSIRRLRAGGRRIPDADLYAEMGRL